MPAAAQKPAGTKPAGRRRNLDEALASARAARAEARGEPPVLEVDGQEIVLPVEMPYDFMRLAAAGDLNGGLLALFGDEDTVGKVTGGMSVDDLQTLVEVVGDVYGASAGK